MYVPGVLGNAPSEVKSSGSRAPAPARPATTKTSKASIAADWDTLDNTRLMMLSSSGFGATRCERASLPPYVITPQGPIFNLPVRNRERA